MLEQHIRMNIKKLEKYKASFTGNTPSVKMRKYAIEKKIAKFKDMLKQSDLIVENNFYKTELVCL